MVDVSTAQPDAAIWPARPDKHAGEDLLMGEAIEVVLARLEGQIKALTDVVEVRLRTQERDVEAYKVSGEREHHQLKQRIEETAGIVRELQEFKSKIYGIGIGLSLASGTISGLLVVLLTGSNGG
jgi:hypothetical protein